MKPEYPEYLAERMRNKRRHRPKDSSYGSCFPVALAGATFFRVIAAKHVISLQRNLSLFHIA